MAVCRPVLQILTLFQTKHCNFPHPFSDLASKIHTRFHVIITNIRRLTKRKIHFEFIGILLFLFYSFGIETTNKFIHPVVSSKTQVNHSRFSTKSLYPVSNRNGPKTIPFGMFAAEHTYVAYIREYPGGRTARMIRSVLDI